MKRFRLRAGKLIWSWSYVPIQIEKYEWFPLNEEYNNAQPFSSETNESTWGTSKPISTVVSVNMSKGRMTEVQQKKI